MCLLEHGADVTETDKDEKTCLMWAAEENRVDAVTVSLASSNFYAILCTKNVFKDWLFVHICDNFHWSLIFSRLRMFNLLKINQIILHLLVVFLIHI